MFAPRWLAITPARLELAEGRRCVDRWLAAGLEPSQTAVLLRDPARRPEQLLAANSALSELARAARDLGIRRLLSVDESQLDEGRAFVRGGAVDGLHLRGRPSVTPLPPEGRSAHLNDLDHTAACALPCAYWTFAPVFPTSSPHKTPVGLPALERACEALKAPVLALGGVHGDQAESCLRAGAHGIAGISAFFGPSDRVEHDARAFVAALDGVLATRS